MKVRERVCVRERVSVGEKRRETSRSPEGSDKRERNRGSVRKKREKRRRARETEREGNAWNERERESGSGMVRMRRRRRRERRERGDCGWLAVSTGRSCIQSSIQAAEPSDSLPVRWCRKGGVTQGGMGGREGMAAHQRARRERERERIRDRMRGREYFDLDYIVYLFGCGY